MKTVTSRSFKLKKEEAVKIYNNILMSGVININKPLRNFKINLLSKAEICDKLSGERVSKSTSCPNSDKGIFLGFKIYNFEKKSYDSIKIKVPYTHDPAISYGDDENDCLGWSDWYLQISENKAIYDAIIGLPRLYFTALVHDY